MLCQKCQKNPATTHIKRTVNGVTTEMHLCAGCAREQGVGHMFGGFSGMGSFHSPFDYFFGNLFAEPALQAGSETKCPGCGDTFNQIVENGKVGCPQCYSTFYDNLLPSIERVHGKTRHIGKRPNVIIEQVPEDTVSVKEEPVSELETLRKQLAECVEKQEYEECAKLRDQIRELEAKEEGEDT